MSATSTEALLPVLASWVRDTGALPEPDARTGASPLLHVVTSDPDLAGAVAEGRSPLSVSGNTAGADIRVTTVDGPAGPVGTVGPGLTPDQVSDYIDRGRELADTAVDSGVRLLLAGGTGDGAVGAAVTGTVCRREPVALVAPYVGTDTGPWKAEVLAVRDALFRARGYRNGPWDEGSAREVLRLLGTPELAVMTGLLVGAVSRRTPVILDGADTLAAALLADAVSPGAPRWWLAPHVPPAPAARFALERLRLAPVIDRDLGPVSGGAALTVLPLLRAAVAAEPPR